jgi:hypothetical protein
MTTLHLTEEQLRLVQTALDFYSRVGIGQFEEIKNHPTFTNHLRNEFKDENGKTDYGRYHEVRDIVDTILVQPRNMLLGDLKLPKNASWGIHNPDVDESCRVAFDIIQVIRHEFWKADSDRSEWTVDSSVHLHTEDGDRIKCEL